MLSRADRVASRRVHDQNTRASRGFQIDVIHTNASSRDTLQSFLTFQKFCGQSGATADDDPIRRLQFFANLSGSQTTLDDDFDTFCLLQNFQSGLGEAV
jgi:hypothetical protein